ncbi:MAG: MFS transporter [Acidobacteria bacterium]|nr:MFS transporter [Acidobacteriota bacterium]
MNPEVGTGTTQEPVTQAPAPPGALKHDRSGFAPLHIPLFRNRWIASTVSGLGTWMQDTAATWLMTALTGSPLLIALMQTAASAPVLLLGLLAGATADIFERRRLLLFWQSWQLVSVALLAILAFLGVIGPWTLLALTFLMNIGSAMNNPAWQAIVPELVPREQLPDAVSLSSASNNLARAVGPAMSGLMVAAFARAVTGAGWVFALNAGSFVAVIWVLYTWKRTPLFKSALPAERVAGCATTGLRFLRYSPPIQAAYIRAFIFTFFVSAVWSLLAVVAAREFPTRGALGYGILNGAMGLGALTGAISLAQVRARWKADQILLTASIAFVAVAAVLAFIHKPWIIVLFLLMGGFAWTCTMSTLNTSVQLLSPGWVSARTLGMYQMVFQGGLALGSILWGSIAEHTNIRIAFSVCGAGLALSIPLTRRLHVLRGKLPDHTPYQWRNPVPHLELEPEPEDGPVRVVIQYIVREEDREAFVRAMHKLRYARLRSGAIRWGIFRDANDPEQFEETFVMESWLEYLRSRERMTAADFALIERVRSLHSGTEPPRVSHQVYAKERE